jgi:pimeloyl-ACP methyl ester carboxylesterase
MNVVKSMVATSQGQVLVRRAGRGERHVVLLQILPFSSRLFDATLPLLAMRGYCATAVDLMGYGGSDRRTAAWLVPDFAANLHEVLEVLTITRCALLGGHFSGLVATHMAITDPERIVRLVLDGVPVWTAETRAKVGAGGIGTQAAWTDDGAAILAQWQAMLAMLRKLNPGLTVNADLAPVMTALFRDWLAASAEPGVARAFAAYDMDAALPNVAQPVLAIAGEHDTQKQSQPRILQLARACRGHMFEGVHPLHDFARPARAADYVDAIAPFLAAA